MAMVLSIVAAWIVLSIPLGIFVSACITSDEADERAAAPTVSLFRPSKISAKWQPY
jgi:hypothetical protein